MARTGMIRPGTDATTASGGVPRSPPEEGRQKPRSLSAGKQCRQVSHVVKDDRIPDRQLRGTRDTASEGKDSHGGGQSGGHTRDAVLNDRTTFWRHIHLPRSMLEDIGGWFSMGHLVDAEDSPIESVIEPSRAQGEPHPFVGSTRRHADWCRDLAECVNHTRHWRKLSLEHRAITRFEFKVPIEAATQMSLDLLVHVGSGSTDESLNDVSFGEWPSEARKNLNFGANCEALAVDQNAITVEDNQVKLAHCHEPTGWNPIGLCSCRGSPVRCVHRTRRLRVRRYAA